MSYSFNFYREIEALLGLWTKIPFAAFIKHFLDCLAICGPFQSSFPLHPALWMFRHLILQMRFQLALGRELPTLPHAARHLVFDKALLRVPNLSFKHIRIQLVNEYDCTTLLQKSPSILLQWFKLVRFRLSPSQLHSCGSNHLFSWE